MSQKFESFSNLEEFHVQNDRILDYRSESAYAHFRMQMKTPFFMPDSDLEKPMPSLDECMQFCANQITDSHREEIKETVILLARYNQTIKELSQRERLHWKIIGDDVYRSAQYVQKYATENATMCALDVDVCDPKEINAICDEAFGNIKIFGLYPDSLS